MKLHPDERLGWYRLPDTRAIRRHFEMFPTTFSRALGLYRAWKRAAIDPCEALGYRDELAAIGRRVGADWADWVCVLRCAAARLDGELPCPPWWEGEDQS